MKSLMHRLFLPVITSHPVMSLATRMLGRGTPIFMIHRLNIDNTVDSGIPLAHLRNCLQYLVDNDYNVIPLEQVLLSMENREALPDRAIVFTMDDGFSEQAEVVAPLFIEFSVPLTFFVITGMIDRTSWPWDAQVSWILENTGKTGIRIEIDNTVLSLDLSTPENRRISRRTIRNFIKEMNTDDIRELVTRLSGHAELAVPDTAPPAYSAMEWGTARKLESSGIRFAPHSKTHRILSKMDHDSAAEEIRGSWETLERELANPLKVFCYPTGRRLDFGPREITLLRQFGYLGAATTTPGFITSLADSMDRRYCLPRIPLPDTMAHFISCCSWLEYYRTTRIPGSRS